MAVKGRRDWGTTVVLLVDLIATLSVSTWGVLYLRTNLSYLIVIVVITLGLAFLIWVLLRAGPTQGKRHGEHR